MYTETGFMAAPLAHEGGKGASSVRTMQLSLAEYYIKKRENENETRDTALFQLNTPPKKSYKDKHLEFCTTTASPARHCMTSYQI